MLKLNNLSIAPGIKISHPCFSGKQWATLCGRHARPGLARRRWHKPCSFSSMHTLCAFYELDRGDQVGMERGLECLGTPSSSHSLPKDCEGLFSYQLNPHSKEVQNPLSNPSCLFRCEESILILFGFHLLRDIFIQIFLRIIYWHRSRKCFSCIWKSK